MSRQVSFAEALLDPRLGSNARLEAIAGVIDWSRLEPIARRIRNSDTGRPPYPPMAMVKALYLQRLYDLSDPGLEEALLDRLSFRRFCGLALESGTPDETTLCRFRSAAAESGVLQACFEEITRQLDAQGLLLKQGTLMDATVVRSRHRPPARSAGLGARHPKEPDADWSYRQGKSYFGYKAHLGVDQGSGLIRQAVVTSAKVYESEVADQLISGDERAVYGDKAYESKKRRAWLKALGIKDRTMRRANKWHALTPRRQHWNNLVSRRRAPVEAVFSAMKRLYGLGRARSPHFATLDADVLIFAAIYNLRRAVLLAKTR